MNDFRRAIREVEELHALLGPTTANDAIVGNLIAHSPSLAREVIAMAGAAHGIVAPTQ